MSEQEEQDTTTTSLEYGGEWSNDPVQRMLLAHHPATPTQQLEILATDQDVRVRQAGLEASL